MWLHCCAGFGLLQRDGILCLAYRRCMVRMMPVFWKRAAHYTIVISGHCAHRWYFLTNRKAIIYTDVSELSWIQSMDACLNIDHLACSSKLRWKSAAKGGRTLATPSHTGPTLSASKRVGGRQASTPDNATVLSSLEKLVSRTRRS